MGNHDEMIQNKDLLMEYKTKKHYKFLIDSMLARLALKLRNLGLDAAFVENMGYKDKVKLAEEEERIIITRDKTFISIKKSCPFIRIGPSNPKGTTPITIRSIKGDSDYLRYQD